MRGDRAPADQRRRKRGTSSGASCARKERAMPGRPNQPEIIVEIARGRRQRERFDACAFGARGQALGRPPSGVIVVAHNIESAQAGGEHEGGEMIGGERCDHRQARQDTPQRQHRLDAFAGGEDIAPGAKPDAVAEQLPHCPPRRRNRRFSRAVAREPGPMHAGDHAGGVGNGGEQRRPALARRSCCRHGRSTAG